MKYEPEVPNDPHILKFPMPTNPLDPLWEFENKKNFV